jgi:hypothetical protein
MHTAQLTFKLALITRSLKILCKGFRVVTLRVFPSLCCELRAFLQSIDRNTEAIQGIEHVFLTESYKFWSLNTNNEQTTSLPTCGLI